MDNDDLALATATQDARQRLGLGVQPLADILAGRAPPEPRRRGAEVVPLSDRQLRRRGLGGQAALLAHSIAEREGDPDKREEWRRIAREARHLSQITRLEFDFWRGNFSVSDHYLDAVMRRLNAPGVSHGLEAKGVLMGLMRFVGKLDPEVRIDSQEQLAEYCGMQRANVTRALGVLERIGAIRRVRAGRRTRIFITPEGVYRGPMDRHAETVAAYANIVELPRKHEP